MNNCREMGTAGNSISVAMCTYNGEKYIREQLDSILGQTLKADEIVIVDDASTDSTVAILTEYQQKYPFIRLVRNEENHGFMYSFQRSIMNTSCDYIALSDQDDIWTNNHIEILYNTISGKDLSVGNSLFVDSSGVSLGYELFEMRDNHYIPSSDAEKAYRVVYNKNPYFGCNMMARREWLLNILPFPEGTPFQLYHDIYLSMFACLTGGMGVTKEVINHYRQHPSQVTRNVKIPIYKELYRKRHFSYWPDREIYMNAIINNPLEKPEKAQAFIEEFIEYGKLDKSGHRFKALRIRNKHYREIYSTRYYKFIFLRSLHFLFSL